MSEERAKAFDTASGRELSKEELRRQLSPPNAPRRWSVEGSVWLGKPDQTADEWEPGREFTIEVEADNCIEALAIAAQRLALQANEELHTIMSVHMHFGRRRRRT